MPKSNQSIQKPYDSSLAEVTTFYVPHADANQLDAQDVVHTLVNSAKNISIASWNCFDGGNRLAVRADIVADLIHEVQTKLEMIEKLLPMAFNDDVGGE